MKRRYFLIVAVATASLLAGCKQGPNEKFLGYWQELDDDMPLHIKPNGNDYMARLGRYNMPAKESSPGIITIETANPLQLKYDAKTNQLQNIDLDKKIVFKRVSEDEFKSIVAKWDNPNKNTP